MAANGAGCAGARFELAASVAEFRLRGMRFSVFKAILAAVALFPSFALGQQRLGDQELARGAELVMADKKEEADAMRMAVSEYPELAKEGSQFHTTFMQLYRQSPHVLWRAAHPAHPDRSDPKWRPSWPMFIAEQTAALLNPSIGAEDYARGRMYATGKGVPQDAAKAFEWYQKAAAQGNADAQTRLGDMYALGAGVPKNYAKAAECYRKAAEAVKFGRKVTFFGDAEAQFTLGLAYLDGNGVPKSEVTAFEFVQKAADQGLAAAQGVLGAMYYEGKGVTKNLNKGLEWVTKSALQGWTGSQTALASHYAATKDVVLAYAWLNLAAANGDSKIVQRRDELEKQLTPEQKAEAQELSAELFAKMPKK